MAVTNTDLYLAGWIAGCAGAGIPASLSDNERYLRGYRRGHLARLAEIESHLEPDDFSDGYLAGVRAAWEGRESPEETWEATDEYERGYRIGYSDARYRFYR